MSIQEGFRPGMESVINWKPGVSSITESPAARVMSVAYETGAPVMDLAARAEIAATLARKTVLTNAARRWVSASSYHRSITDSPSAAEMSAGVAAMEARKEILNSGK